MLKRMLLLIGFFFVVLWTSCNEGGPNLSIHNLRTEYLHNPLGIDITPPRLSWVIASNDRDVMQTAYQILVASSPGLLEKDSADLWNSGKIASDSTVGIKYAGKPLKSREDCYWKVKIWTNGGKETESKIAHWGIGLLNPTDWNAHWTGLDSPFSWEAPDSPHTRLSARYFRKAFKTNKEIKRAVVYISGLGIYQFYLNGEKIGNAELSPDPTQYDKRVFYNTYDVTKGIKKGENVIGTILGNGRFFSMRYGQVDQIPPIMNFGFPKMLLQLEITYEDGSVQKIISDSTWKVTAHGPVVANNEFDGEDYNALLEMPGWSTPGFDDSKWLSAQQVSAPCATVEAQMDPLITVMDSLSPESVTPMGNGKYLVDMGQNMVGWARISIPDGQKGDTVTLQFAERINPDSSLYTANLRSAEQTDHYIMKNGKQVWEPHFTYHGFRYVMVKGYPGKLKSSDIQGRVVYDDLPTTGHFETSNKTINQVYHNAFWGIRGNYRGMPTDCPQRDERMGWLGDRAVGSYGESFIFDNNTLYAKWLQDIADAQKTDGSIPDVAPTYWKIYSDNMTWPGTYLTVANMLYHQFGNLKPIKQHYASMKKWLSYMKDKYMKDYILYKDTYGDWCMPPKDPNVIHSNLPERLTAGALLGTATYCRMLQLMAHFATLLHKPKDKEAFEDLEVKMKSAYNQKYLNDTTGAYSNNTATADVLSLAYGLVPDSLHKKTFQQVVNTTMNEFQGHISTGLVGAQQLMRTLTRNNRADIAYKLASNTTYPSWGYMAKEGATTIWELWNGNTANPAMNSGNHVMLLGDLIVWFYEDLAGIKSDPNEVGFKKIIMKPYPVKGLNHVEASYHSVHGMIKSEWQTNNGTFDWKISVPANTTATIYIPAKSMENITEGGKKINKINGISYISSGNGRAIFEIGSGKYHFVSSSL